jgi:hypothetical protein
MQKEIAAALKAANAYKPVNEGDAGTAALVVAMLTDAAAKAAVLEDLAESHERLLRLRAAEDELRAAQSA